jgi:DnaA N-terminal domain
MGDNAVRWALQQTHFGPVAQLILIRLCKHLDDRRPIWSWRKRLSVIIEECNASADTLNRHCYELEGKDKEGNPVEGVTPVLFRAFNKGRPTEYIILGPNKTITDAYIAELYPAQKSPQVAATNPPQVAATLPTAECGDPRTYPPQVAAAPPQVAATHQDRNILSNSSKKDSLPTETGKNQLREITKSGIAKIQKRLDPQLRFSWYDPELPVVFDRGRGELVVHVSDPHFAEWLASPDRKRIMIEHAWAAGLKVKEITFVAPGSLNGDPWRQILDRVERNINAQRFSTWFKPTELVRRDGKTFYVRVPNAHFQNWLSEHVELVFKAALDVGFGKIQVVYLAERDKASPARASPS